MNAIKDNKTLMYINFTKHSLERCVERNPKFKSITYQKHAEEEARYFLEEKIREWLSSSWQENLNLRRRSDWKWYITLTDWEHKIVYVKDWIWEITLITYAHRGDIEKLEWEVLKMLPRQHKNSRYKKF